MVKPHTKRALLTICYTVREVGRMVQVCRFHPAAAAAMPVRMPAAARQEEPYRRIITYGVRPGWGWEPGTES